VSEKAFGAKKGSVLTFLPQGFRKASFSESTPKLPTILTALNRQDRAPHVKQMDGGQVWNSLILLRASLGSNESLEDKTQKAGQAGTLKAASADAET